MAKEVRPRRPISTQGRIALPAQDTKRAVHHDQRGVVNDFPVRKGGIDGFIAVAINVVLEIMPHHPLVFRLSMQQQTQTARVECPPRQRIQIVRYDRTLGTQGGHQMGHQSVENGDDKEKVVATKKVQIAKDDGVLLEEPVVQVMKVVDLRPRFSAGLRSLVGSALAAVAPPRRVFLTELFVARGRRTVRLTGRPARLGLCASRPAGGKGGGQGRCTGGGCLLCRGGIVRCSSQRYPCGQRLLFSVYTDSSKRVPVSARELQLQPVALTDQCVVPRKT